MELLEYWHLFRKWLWLIILAAIVAGAAAYGFSIRQTPIYQASTRLRVNQGSSANPNITYSDLLLSERLSATYAQMLTAKPILTAAFEAVGLDAQQALEQAEVSVQPVRDTQLIDLKVEHPVPQLAAAIANALPKVFIDFNNKEQTARFQESKASLQAELDLLSDQIDEAEKAITALNGASDLENENRRLLLENRLAQYRNSYSNVLSQLEVIRLAEANEIDTITVVEPASLPISPVRPRVMMNVLLALIVGAMIGLGAAFLIEYLDDTVKTPDDVDRVTGLSTLGVLARDKNGKKNKVRVVALEDPRSSNTEAFRAIRTGIQFSSVDAPIRTLLVTSPEPGNGKSTAAANLALVMAQAGKRVVLIDADLRKPTQHKIWGLPNNVGLTGTLLMAELPDDLDYLLSPTTEENLKVVTSGQLPHNPSELLGSQKLQLLCQRLLSDHDYLIFDSPPALIVTDPIVLGQAADGVLLVVEAGQTRAPALAQTMIELGKVNANVIGVALNKFKQGRGSYYYYSYYYDSDRYYGHDAGDRSANGKHARKGKRRRSEQAVELDQRQV